MDNARVAYCLLHASNDSHGRQTRRGEKCSRVLVLGEDRVPVVQPYQSYQSAPAGLTKSFLLVCEWPLLVIAVRPRSLVGLDHIT